MRGIGGSDNDVCPGQGFGLSVEGHGFTIKFASQHQPPVIGTVGDDNAA